MIRAVSTPELEISAKRLHARNRSRVSSTTNSRRVSVRTDFEVVDDSEPEQSTTQHNSTTKWSFRKRRSMTPEMRRSRPGSTKSEQLQPKTTKTALLRQRIAIEQKRAAEAPVKIKKMKRPSPAPRRRSMDKAPSTSAQEAGDEGSNWRNVPIDRNDLKLDFRGLHDDEDGPTQYAPAKPIASASPAAATVSSRGAQVDHEEIRQSPREALGNILRSTVDLATGFHEEPVTKSYFGQNPEEHGENPNDFHNSAEKENSASQSRKIAAYSKRSRSSKENDREENFHAVKERSKTPTPPSATGSVASSKKLASYRRTKLQSQEEIEKRSPVDAREIDMGQKNENRVESFKKEKDSNRLDDLDERPIHGKSIRSNGRNQAEQSSEMEQKNHDAMIGEEDNHKGFSFPSTRHHDDDPLPQPHKNEEKIDEKLNNDPADQFQFQGSVQNREENIHLKNGSPQSGHHDNDHQNGQTVMKNQNGPDQQKSGKSDHSKKSRQGTARSIGHDQANSHGNGIHPTEHRVMVSDLHDQADHATGSVEHGQINGTDHKNENGDHLSGQPPKPGSIKSVPAAKTAQLSSRSKNPQSASASVKNIELKEIDAQSQKMSEKLKIRSQPATVRSAAGTHTKSKGNERKTARSVVEDAGLLTPEKLDTIRRYLEEQANVDQDRMSDVHEAIVLQQTNRSEKKRELDPVYHLTVVIERITEEKRQLTDLCAQLLQQMQITTTKLIEIETRQEESLLAFLPKKTEPKNGNMNEKTGNGAQCEKCNELKKMHSEEMEMLKKEYEERTSALKTDHITEIEKLKQEIMNLQTGKAQSIDNTAQMPESNIHHSTEISLVEPEEAQLEYKNKRESARSMNGDAEASPSKTGHPFYDAHQKEDPPEHIPENKETTEESKTDQTPKFSLRLHDLQQENNDLKKQMEELQHRCDALTKLIKLG